MDTKEKRVTTAFLWLWIVLLVPWCFFFPLSAMAFDGGYTLGAYVFFWSVACYPVTVIVAGFTRKKVPALIFLPFLSFAGAFMPDLVHTLRH
jgi:hypothetical protein